MKQLLKTFCGLLFPQYCPVCNQASHLSPANPLCTDCWNSITPYTGPACRQCGIPTVSPHTIICQSCLSDPPPFSRVASYGIYEGVLKEAIHQLKFHKKRRLARQLALLLCDLELPHADLIVPVPVHLNRLRQREFNQTALIARHLSKIIHIPLELYALRKVRDTAPQVQMNREKRLKNLKKAFQADDIVSGKHILLIDDVITTGATAKACATSLIKAGAVEVTIAAVAYSLPKY